MSTAARANPGLIELGRKNQAGGYVGIDGSGDVIGTFAQRRDTAANIAGIVLANGELAFTTDTKETFIGDGTTAGGVFLWQKPQWGNMNYSSLIAAPASGAATNLTSLVFANPVILEGYRIRVLAEFNGAPSDSNFAVYVDTGVSVPFGASLAISEKWVNYSGVIIESRDMLQIAAPPSWPFELLTNLTESGCSLILDFDIMPRMDLTLYEGPETVLGPMAVTACRRTGAGNSGATATLFATCQRMWIDGRVA